MTSAFFIYSSSVTVIVEAQLPLKNLTNAEKSRFRKAVLGHYRVYGRDLPWRKTQNPYHILISEFMLQQTQVDRVISKYISFIKAFPTMHHLRDASLAEVLKQWQGLGYNRRAKFLYQCACELSGTHNGQVPRTFEQLLCLPGIGAYTASAICVFAFNQPLVFIETNIRAVFLHCFFADEEGVTDSRLFPLIKTTLYRKNPSLWYNALMDYGVHIKNKFTNPSRKSAHYSRQSPFEGSDRQMRGLILKRLIKKGACTFNEIIGENRDAAFSQNKVKKIITQLEREGFILRMGRKYRIAD